MCRGTCNTQSTCSKSRKIANDLRSLSSDLGHKDISIPKKQTGSSIMPGKINPVIPEFIISAARKVYANDHLITDLAAMGCLDLNAYLPLLGHALIDSLKLLVAAGKSMHFHLLEGLSVHGEVALNRLLHSPSLTTALVPYLGYNTAALLAAEMKESNSGIFEANNKLKLIGDDILRKILEPSRLLRLGYSLNDTTND
ncbi:MAG: hypothetical protein HC830_03520 [Bacteroidetes bacterium]|nr:hypothetical protein [Bacteroidota bacterium]